MPFQKIWLIIILLSLAACGVSPGATESGSTTRLTVSPPTQAASPSPQPSPPTLTRTPSPLPPTSTPVTPTLAAATPTSSVDSTTAGADPVLVYERSGGLADFTVMQLIYAQGRVVTEGEEWQVRPEEVEQLLEEIEAAGFFELEENYVPKDTCCDRATYHLTVEQNGKKHTVTTLESTPGIPTALQTTLILVNNFFNKAPQN